MTAECKIGCEEVKNVDSDTLLEQNFRETSKNVSRKWLIRDASSKQKPTTWYSTMKGSYDYPEREVTTLPIGARRRKLLRQFQDEATKETIQELDRQPEEEERLSEYEDKFDMCGFRPDDEAYRKQSELYQKYPLYSSMGVSYYSFNLAKVPKEVLHGHSKSPSIVHPFRRNTEFSKNLDEVLDCNVR